MHLIQIFIIVFVFFALSRTVVRFREGALTRRWLFLWSILWLMVGVAAVLPQTTSRLAELIGVGRGVDAVLYLSVISLFYLVFRIFLRLQKIDHDISLLVREMGLKRALGEEEEEKR